ncbi:MAG: hypothetical protein NC911_03445 [Candidatus Omnitrophica bacterium]|nr:hypothetical protein [Candidatus Omnitrophota bacterium]MCM8768722.1 hypothetical protein [Candidatus Omnitrophota bacterium]
MRLWEMSWSKFREKTSYPANKSFLIRGWTLKKIWAMWLVSGCLLGVNLILLAQDSSSSFQDELAVKMKQLRELRQKMATIEWKASQEDEELKKLNEQYRELQKKLQEITDQREQRLKVVLKDHAEYQDLKKRSEELRRELRLIPEKTQKKGSPAQPSSK